MQIIFFFFLNENIEYGSQCKYIVLVIESKIYENKVTLKPYCTIIEREICSCATKERSINFGRLLGINFFTKCIKTQGNFWMKLLLKFISQKLLHCTWTIEHTFMPHPLSICTWSLKSLVHKIDFWTWFFVYFKLDFHCLCSLQKSSLK